MFVHYATPPRLQRSLQATYKNQKMFIEKRISLALIWYIILPHNHYLTLHKVANAKLVYVLWFHKIYGTGNGKNGTLLFAFLRQTSSVCLSKVSLDDETDKTHSVPDLDCMEGVKATRTPDTAFLPMSIIAFSL